MSGSRSGRGPIPKRWLHCPRKATDLIEEKFLAFKTPLCDKFDDQVQPECRFPPEFIFSYAKSRRIKFGLWIDLTNTKRFYDKSDIERNDCKYLKLACKGREETPTVEQTDKFIMVVKNFITMNPTKCVAVHCTHGFNRTGFLITSYLVKAYDYDLELALNMFSEVRQPGIYKQDYLNELYRRYGNIEDVIRAPMLPSWCEEEEDDDNSACIDMPDTDVPTSSNSTINNSNQNHKRKNGKVPVFMEGVPKVSAFLEQPKASHLQKKVKDMCGWNKKDFPGCQPVSMDTLNIKLLAEKPYMVSWKADGMRYMMLIDGEDEVYFFDRDYNVFKVEGLRFVNRKNLEEHLTDTLLDGEMVIDKVGNEKIPRYLAYDIVMFNDVCIAEKPFCPDRLNFIQYEIINPRHKAIEKGLIRKEREPFSVRKKDFWDITQTASLLGDKFAKNLSHEPDGLIFQPSKEPYVCGQCPEVLKWKPLELNSVDFRLKIEKRGGHGIIPEKVCSLYVGQYDLPVATMKYTSAIKALDNKIIECKYEDGQWKFMRERTDKSYPNSHKTATSVFESIKNPITKEALIDFINKRRYTEGPPTKRHRS